MRWLVALVATLDSLYGVTVKGELRGKGTAAVARRASSKHAKR